MLRKKSDETAQILKTFSRLGVDVDMQADGLIKIGAGAAPDAILDAIDELRLLPGRNVWFSGSTIYINSPNEEALKAVAKLQTAVESGADDATKTRLIEEIVEATTHGSGDRVVLGAWKENSGYILEAIGSDGLFFETSDEVWEWIEATGVDPWLVNKAVLQKYDKQGLQFEFTSRGMDSYEWEIDMKAIEALRKGDINEAFLLIGRTPAQGLTYRLREAQWLLRQGYNFSMHADRLFWIKP